MYSYVLLKDGKTLSFENIKDLSKYFFGEEYLMLSEEEKISKRYENAFTLKMLDKKDFQIVHTQIGIFDENYKIQTKKYNLKEDFIIDTDITYILSICKTKKYILLEKNDVKNILLEGLKLDLNFPEDEYIMINKYIDKLKFVHSLKLSDIL